MPCKWVTGMRWVVWWIRRLFNYAVGSKQVAAPQVVFSCAASVGGMLARVLSGYRRHLFGRCRKLAALQLAALQRHLKKSKKSTYTANDLTGHRSSSLPNYITCFIFACPHIAQLSILVHPIPLYPPWDFARDSCNGGSCPGLLHWYCSIQSELEHSLWSTQI